MPLFPLPYSRREKFQILFYFSFFFRFIFFSPTSNILGQSRGWMSLLDHLWDDTVAGPAPSGLNKPRLSSSSVDESASAGGSLQVTRSITILRPSSSTPRSGSPPDSASAPASPASATDSPRTPATPRGDWRMLRRNPAVTGSDPVAPRKPTVYDWVVISALDK